MATKKIDLTKESFEALLDKFVEYAEEERELALDRYRRQDLQILSPEDFIIQGKNAVDYLKTASERTNSLLTAAKMMQTVIFKDNEGNKKAPEGLNDELKKQIVMHMRQKDQKEQQ